MKYIVVGLNEIIFTLKDRIKLTNPFILLRLINTNQSKEEKLMLVIDTATASQNHNVLNMTLDTDINNEDLANGIVTLTPGNYHYQVYESTASTLDITGLCILEKGIMRYEDDLANKIELNRNDNILVL